MNYAWNYSTETGKIFKNIHLNQGCLYTKTFYTSISTRNVSLFTHIIYSKSIKKEKMPCLWRKYTKASLENQLRSLESLWRLQKCHARITVSKTIIGKIPECKSVDPLWQFCIYIESGAENTSQILAFSICYPLQRNHKESMHCYAMNPELT